MTKVRIQELTKDSLLRVKRSNQIIRVERVDEAAKTFHIKGFPDQTISEDDPDLEPIQLTGEWLTKLGFKSSPYNSINSMLGTLFERGELRYIIFANGVVEAYYKERSIFPFTTVHNLQKAIIELEE